MGDIGEYWKDARASGYRRKRAPKGVRNAPKLERGHRQLGQLAAEGYEIKKLTPYQWRINGVLDCFPTSNKYHDLRTNERGVYDTMQDVRELLTLGDNTNG